MKAMNTNRKTRPQPSFASLTTDEYHQLADMVRTRTYNDILQQINKPRADGGFDLDISIKPLQVLHRRVTELDRLNKLIADGQKLTLTAYDELQAGQTPPTEQIHNAILNATWLQVQYNENTPHQLLALQRLADFPVRSALRDQMAEIRENREQIHQEKHTHKIQMDTFRKQHATERLDLAKRSLALREKNAAFKQDLALCRLNLTLNRNPNLFSSDEDSSDALDNNNATPADLNALPSLENPVDPVHPVETPSETLSTLNPQRSTFLSPEVIANNKLYDQKIDSGEIRVIYAPGKHYEIEYCNPADQPALERLNKSAPLRFFEDPTRTQWLPALRTFGPNPYIPPTSAPAKPPTLSTQPSTYSDPSDPELRAEPDREMDAARPAGCGPATNCATAGEGEIAPAAENFGSRQAGWLDARPSA